MKKLLGVTIAISLAIIAMLSFIAVPSFASEPASYSATVATGQSIVVDPPINGSFGTLLVSNIKMINNSIFLNNTGDMNGTVSARFSTNLSGFYGLVNISSGNVIGAANFSLAKAGSGIWAALDNTGANVNDVVIVPKGEIIALDAKLTVPSVQAGAYDGTVILTFETVV